MIHESHFFSCFRETLWSGNKTSEKQIFFEMANKSRANRLSKELNRCFHLKSELSFYNFNFVANIYKNRAKYCSRILL